MSGRVEEDFLDVEIWMVSSKGRGGHLHVLDSDFFALMNILSFLFLFFCPSR